MKKTVLQYLELIPDPVIRKQAINNHFKEYGQEWCMSIDAALFRAFNWNRSPQGYAYWKKVHDDLFKREQLTGIVIMDGNVPPEITDAVNDLTQQLNLFLKDRTTQKK